MVRSVSVHNHAVAPVPTASALAEVSAVIDDVEAGASYVITKRGRPAAVLVPVEEAEDLVLANAEEYVRTRRAASRGESPRRIWSRRCHNGRRGR